MKSGEPRTVLPFGQHAALVTRPPPEEPGDWPQQGQGRSLTERSRVTLGSSPASQQTLAGLLTSREPRRTIPLHARARRTRLASWSSLRTSRRDFLPRFIESATCLSRRRPRTQPGAVVHRGPGDSLRRPGLVDSGTEPVTETFRFVASTFSDVGTFDWETLASGVAGDFAYTAAVERYTNSREGGPPEGTELRATHVYRREGGHWRAVHRHADRRPPQRDDLTEVVEAFRDALRLYVTGNPEPVISFFSNQDDVTLANPLEPPCRGPADVGEAARRAAANFAEGGSPTSRRCPAPSRRSRGSPLPTSGTCCSSSGMKAASPAATTPS